MAPTRWHLTVNNIDCFLNNQRDPGLDMMMDTESTTEVAGFSLAHHFGPIAVSATYTYTRRCHQHQTDLRADRAAPRPQQAIVNTYGAWPDIDDRPAFAGAEPDRADRPEDRACA